MIAALLFMTSRGEVVLSRAFRDGVVIRNLADTFRDEIISTKRVERAPVNIVDRLAFIHFRHENLLLVAVGRPDVNAFLVIQLLLKLMQLLADYYGHVSEPTIKDNFITIQELIDETIDFGYPQITESELLKTYVTSGGGIKGDAVRRAKDAQKITINATGNIPWRKDGIVYKDNEVFLDVVEEVNLLMSQAGDVLQRDIVGRIVFRCFLSGMPECFMTINDKALLSTNSLDRQQIITDGDGALHGNAGGASHSSADGVGLDDVSFHPCVRLGAFDAERAISFVPPDGEFVLMRYRTSGNLVPPLKVLFSRAKEISKTRMEIDFHLQCDIDPKYFISNIVVKIPCPANTANAKVRVLVGKAKYDPAQQAIVWKMRRMEGGSTSTAFSAEVNMIAVTVDSDTVGAVWGRPPISLSFSTEVYSASGLRVDKLKVTESKLLYDAKKWVRYLSTAGQYQCRL